MPIKAEETTRTEVPIDAVEASAEVKELQTRVRALQCRWADECTRAADALVATRRSYRLLLENVESRYHAALAEKDAEIARHLARQKIIEADVVDVAGVRLKNKGLLQELCRLKHRCNRKLDPAFGRAKRRRILRGQVSFLMKNMTTVGLPKPSDFHFLAHHFH